MARATSFERARESRWRDRRPRRLALGAALALAAGCAGSPDCAADTDVLVAASDRHPALTCGQAGDAVRYIEMIAARGIPEHQARRVIGAVADRFRSAPAVAAAQLEGARTALSALRGARDPSAGVLRSQLAYEGLNGSGPFEPGDGLPYSVLKAAVAPWATHTEDRLVLTEMDIEGWVRYASLCREVQGGGPLVLSLGDRQGAYRALVERFDSGTTAERRALVSLGPFWPGVARRWKEATYEDQQRWIGGAPLPAPMTGTSLEYIEAVVAMDLAVHVRFLHDTLGPFVLSVP